MLHGFKTMVTSVQELPTRPKIALIIINPNSGKKRGVKALAVIKPIFENAGIECKVFETTHAGHCAEICEKEDLTNIDILVPVGGDGTLHEACNGLMARTDDAAKRVVIAASPAGSGNTLAYDLGLVDVAQAAEVAVAGKFRAIDLAAITTLDAAGQPVPGKRTLYSVNMIGWALPSKVMSTANSFRKCGCGAWYNYAINEYIITNDNYKARITYKTADGVEHTQESKVALMVVQNSVHIGAKLPLAPEAKLDDGLLDLSLVFNRNIISNVITFNLAKKAKHTKRSQVMMVKCTEVTLQPLDDRLKGPDSVNVDGELTGPSPCRINVVPGALRIFCPA